MNKILYLASKSPRRRKLIKLLNIPVKTFTVDVKESFNEKESFLKNAKRIALEKLEAAKIKVKQGVILTADTIVVLEDLILGKPKDEKDAFKMLKSLSGKEHIVYTAFAIFDYEKEKTIVDYEKTKVKFRKLKDEEILEYVKSGSPLDKAGAYGIQDDFGAVFIEKINGCYYNVVGLPLQKVYLNLKTIFNI
jgi:septum formation protein